MKKIYRGKWVTISLNEKNYCLYSTTATLLHYLSYKLHICLTFYLLYKTVLLQTLCKVKGFLMLLHSLSDLLTWRILETKTVKHGKYNQNSLSRVWERTLVWFVAMLFHVANCKAFRGMRIPKYFNNYCINVTDRFLVFLIAGLSEARECEYTNFSKLFHNFLTSSLFTIPRKLFLQLRSRDLSDCLLYVCSSYRREHLHFEEASVKFHFF